MRYRVVDVEVATVTETSPLNGRLSFESHRYLQKKEKPDLTYSIRGPTLSGTGREGPGPLLSITPARTKAGRRRT